MGKPRASSEIVPVAGCKVAIVASKWHPECVRPMIERCQQELALRSVEEIQVHHLPGCYELPLASRLLFQKTPDLEAIIAFGVIEKGDTDHYEMIRDEVMRGFSKVMFEFNKPIIMEVLAVRTLEDAMKRSRDDERNKGYEAAVALSEIVSWRRKLGA